MISSLEFRSSLIEPLEPRIVLDIGGANPPTIVVGRTLSAYDVPDVANHQETLTLTVYNQAADPISGVLLTDTLASGVTFATASQLPDRNGQQLAWSLGTIQPYDRASVTLTVSLADPIPTSLDTGAAAYGTLDAGMVSWTTAPATLRSTEIAPALLASTPDANTTDPYVQEKAAELNYDPQQIFNFLHNDIGYNSYVGSLRGARGTLWSSAGNSLDVASLGIALMRASGIPAQYEDGTLSTAQAQQLILSMFPASYQTVGYIPAGTKTADPANDPQLLSETMDHFWFQFDAGAGMKDADPLYAGLQVGQSAAASENSFTEVPDNLRQKTEVKLTAEMYSQAAAVFGLSDGLSRNVVLDRTFNAVDLVGRPLTIGNFVSSTSTSFIFSAQTNTYTPYLVVGDDALPNSQLRDAVTGTPFQEVLTNFPFSSQILTGLFLDVTLSGPNGPSQIYDRALLDRIGYAAREGQASVSAAVNSSGAPVLSPLDAYTIDVESGRVDASVGWRVSRQMSAADAELTTTPQDAPSAVQPGSAGVELSIEATRAAIQSYQNISTITTANLAAFSGVVAYSDSPRIIIASNYATANSDTLALDLVRDAYRAMPCPGQNAGASAVFQSICGQVASVIEDQVIPPAAGASRTGAVDVFQAASAQGVPIVTLTPARKADISKLSLPPDAMARITDALEQGLDVFVPQKSVAINGSPTIAWYQFNPVTGQTIDVAPNGAHQALAEYSAAEDGEATEDAAVIEPEVQSIKKLREMQSELEEVREFLEETVKPAIKAGVETAGLIHYVQELIENVEEQGTQGAGKTLAGELWGLFFKTAAELLAGEDPPVAQAISNLQMPAPPSPSNVAQLQAVENSNTPADVVSGLSNLNSLAATGTLSAVWASNATNTFQVQLLVAAAATVTRPDGTVLGSGTASINVPGGIAASVTGDNQYSISGDGGLSFFGAAETELGVSGDWNNYSATASGGVSVTLSTDRLTLNGQALPAGTYTIKTNSATVSGSGLTTAPNFAGSVSITASGGTVQLGPGTGSLSVGGAPINAANETTLAGYNGTIDVSANGDGTDAVTLNGNAANLLTVAPSPAILTADQNTPVTFQANVDTSFADAYNLTANAPPSWTVTVDHTGKITVTPAPGTQSGTYPIQIIAQSTTNPDLVSQATVAVTVTPTQPGMTFAVSPDPIFTVPFDGAQVPSAFRATLQNTGPAADTYSLAFSGVPAGFTILNSGTSITVPAGQTGILGIYLQPNGGPLPPPGTQVSFTVTATSATDPAITHSQTVTFTMPAIDAVTASANPAAVSTTPGSTAGTTLTLANVGNMSQNVAVEVATPAGLTASGVGPATLGIGQSTTEALQLTPAAGTPLNTTLTATVSYAPQPASDVVKVLAVSPHPSPLPEGEGVLQGFVEAGETVDVSATVFDGVANQRQALASYTVVNSAGTVVLASSAVPLELTAIAATETVDLGPLSTAGLTAGAYTINVTLTEQNGTPIAGAAGQAMLLIHSPVTASLSLDTPTQAPGNAAVTDTLTLASNDLLGSLATDGSANSVAVLGNLAYVADTQDIAVVDISDPARPQLVTTFGSKDIAQGGQTFVRLLGTSELVVASQDTGGGQAGFKLLVYSLADPSKPALVGSTPVKYRYVQDLFVRGATALATTGGIYYSQPGTITGQFGDLVSLDLGNPASPAVAGVLTGSQAPPDGGASNEHGVVAVSSSLAYVLGSTSTGAAPQTGGGVVQVVNYADPTKLSLVNTLQIPGAVQALAIAIQGNEALVVGSSGGWKNPFNGPADIGLSGNVTLTMLDISDAANPKVIGSTVVTKAALPAGATLGEVTAVALGGGLFAVGDVEENGQSVLLTVDANDPTDLAVNSISAPSNINGMTIAGDELLTASAGGLTVYRIGALFSQTAGRLRHDRHFGISRRV